LSINAQYGGGINDGYVCSGVSTTNLSPNIYKGGKNDGVSSQGVSIQNSVPSIYFGGKNDGVSFASVINQNAVPAIYTGGINDGISFINAVNQNAVPSIYFGGKNDGVSFNNVINQNAVPNIYTGGINDGFNLASSKVLNASPGIYSGGISDGWSGLLATNQNQTVISLLPFNLKVFIQGFYLGNRLMQPVLFNNALSNDPTACDSITVLLYDSQNPVVAVASANAILHSNGNALVMFSNTLFNHSVYVVVRHRNSIETWSKLPVIFGNNTIFDFTVKP
jgi:hypothetical protein